LKKYVKGCAYTFFKLEIMMACQQWELKTFFKELFNYCFPPNFILAGCGPVLAHVRYDSLEETEFSLLLFFFILLFLFNLQPH
ncbi:hypothetical protein K439DRAFT_1332319, partial [Ramaria rubella]